MRILLINPPFDYYSPHLLIKEPLSLAYLAGYLKKYNYKVGVVDAQAGNISKKNNEWHYGLFDHEVIEKVKEFNPDLAGITCPFSLRIDATLQAARLVKRINNKIITVVGGIHPTIFPLETVRNKEVDYVIMGEGEESFLSLIRHIESGNKFSEFNVDGCAYKNEQEAKLIPKNKFIEDLDTIPFPARELLPIDFYLQRPAILYGLGKRRAASVITSRGCPGNCAFCNMFQTHGRKWRGRSAQNVFEEIKILLEKYQIEEVFFMDDNLTFDKGRMVELCRMILDKGIKFRWNTPNGIAADCLDSDLVTLMKNAGCANICIGIESGNETVRNKIIGKGLSEEIIWNALRTCQKAGLPVVGFFILGIPGENENRFKDTLRMVNKLPFSMVATSFFTPFPGTRLYEECICKRYIDKDYWSKIYRFNMPIVETPDFDKNRLRKWEKQIYYEFFKSHFWSLAFSTLSLRNDFFKWQQIRRFIKDKFNF